MAKWSVQPEENKSIVERNIFTKGENTFVYDICWRGGEFYVYTDDDDAPDLEEGVDIYDCDYETELVETYDSCWEDSNYDECDEDAKEWLENFFEEGNSYFELEEHDWSTEECQMFIICPLVITKVED
jgi:hypothetical protein